MPRVNVKDKRKQQLMEAAIASIARRGLADTTIAHVSKGAGMSRGIVNFYFTSKEKMLLETLAHLTAEYTAAWQDALVIKRKETDNPVQLVETLLRTLLGDKLCSLKRMAVWAAFIGHAGTHAGYAKLIRSADDALIRQLKDLWQKGGFESKAAEQRARQVQAFIRGHHIMGALGMEEKRPSSYCDAWAELLTYRQRAAEVSTGAKPKAVAPVAKPKKPAAPHVLPGQLDFADLFSR